MVLAEDDVVAERSFANLPEVQVLQAGELSAYDVLRNDWVLFTDATLPGAGPAGQTEVVVEVIDEETGEVDVLDIVVDEESGETVVELQEAEYVSPDDATDEATEEETGVDGGPGDTDDEGAS